MQTAKTIKISTPVLAVVSALLAVVEVNAKSPEGREQLLKLEGCFLTDYNFAEKESLSAQYTREDLQQNSKRYDASVIEWIGLVEDEGDSLVFQRIMRLDRGGEFPYHFKHHAEEWSYEPEFVYDYLGNGLYSPRTLDDEERISVWKRDTKSLDDGTRYQCVGSWIPAVRPGQKTTWTCKTYAPIPGRETRDMNRDDYQGLLRKSQIHANDWGWKELQWNKKIREDGDERIALVSELGNTTYVRLDDAHCAGAKAYWEKRKDFWKIVREVWKDVLNGRETFALADEVPRLPRYRAINNVAESFSPGFILKGDDAEYSGFSAESSEAVYDAVLEVINRYRE